MSNVLSPSQKLDVVELLETAGVECSKTISNNLGITTKQIGAIKTWYNKDKNGYKSNLINLINAEKRNIDKINKLYAKANNDFKNVVGKYKKEARQIMVNSILKGKEHGLNRGVIATLPSNTWAIEELIHNQVSKSFSYLACENKKSVFIDMVSNLNKFGRNNKPFLGSLSEVITNAKENEFDHIIADYCGVLDTFKDEIIHACLNKVVKVGGTISVTTLKARNDNEFTSKLNTLKADLSNTEVRLNDNESAIKMFFKSLCSITNFEVETEFCYKDTTPMILVVLKRTK